MKQIIFLFVTPALSGDEKKYKLQYLLDLGYKVEIVDLTPLLVPDTDKAISHDRFGYSGIRYRRTYNKKEIEKYISDNRTAFFLPMFNDYYEVRLIYQLFSKYKIHYGYVNNLEADFDSSLQQGIHISSSLRMGLHHLVATIYNRMIRKLPGRKKADFCTVGTQYAIERVPGICDCDKHTRILKVHTFDYERFCDLEPYNNDGKQYAVFVDQYVPYHPDLTVDAYIHMNPTSYYFEVNHIINAISKREAIEVIIAAHPRSDYRDKPECFRGYRIEYGKTTELIKGASFVIGHFSTALGMAAAAQRPVIIVDNPTISSIKSFDSICKGYANQLGCPLVRNADDVKHIEIGADKAKYDAYVKQFMTTGENDSKSIWDVVDEFLCGQNE